MSQQIPVINGIYAKGADFRTSYPVNMVPVPVQHGISNGYLRPADGLIQRATGPGKSRGAIVWNGACYRVMGTKLCKVEGSTVTELGDVGGDGLCSFAYSFDRLAITSGGNLYYYDGSSLSQVTDEDLGIALDVAWIDGYFVTVDGEFAVVTELSDPTKVNPLKYGSSEVDPDPVIACKVNRNELYLVNRHTIEVFANVGGDFFPFQRINGAHIQKGACGIKAVTVFADSLAFVGSGRNEAPAVYMGDNGQTVKISTREIDLYLSTLTDAQLALIELEALTFGGHKHLYVHCHDRTFVYDASATVYLEEPIWFNLTSASDGFSQYLGRHFVWLNGEWLVGDPTSGKVGYTSQETGSHWGQTVRHELQTMIVYGEAGGGIFHRLELVCLTGGVAVGVDPQIATSYSTNGETWSMPKWTRAGSRGQLAKRITWMQQGLMNKWRVQRFQWSSDAHLTVARLEAEIEPLMV